MKSEIKETSGCTRKLHIEIERERFEDEVKVTLRKLKKEAQIPGFRKGKAPEEMLLRRYKSGIEEEAIKDLIPTVMEEAFKEQNLKPVGDPKISDMHFEETGPITFDVTVEELPSIDVEGFRGLEVAKEILEVTDEDVDASLERLRRSRAVQEEVDREARENDILVVNLQKLDSTGVPIIGERIENHVFPLDGKSTPSPEFDLQMMGVRKGEARKVVFTYDESINNPDLVGVTEAYEVEVLRIFENRLPELNDEFAQSVGSYADLADLRTRTQESIKVQYARITDRKLEWSLVDEFIKQNPFEVPNSMVERVTESEIEKAREEHPDEQLDEEALRNRMRPDAVRSVQTFLITQAVQESQKLDVSREEISEHLEILAQVRGTSAREIRRALIKEGRFDEVKSELLQNKAYAWIESVANIREEIVPRNAPQSRIITP